MAHNIVPGLTKPVVKRRSVAQADLDEDISDDSVLVEDEGSINQTEGYMAAVREVSVPDLSEKTHEEKLATLRDITPTIGTAKDLRANPKGQPKKGK